MLREEAVKDITTDIEDVLTYALYPSTGLKFLRIKHGLDPMPPEMMDESTPDKATAQGTQQARTTSDRVPSRLARTFSVYVDGEHFEVEVDPTQARAKHAHRPGGGDPACSTQSV